MQTEPSLPQASQGPAVSDQPFQIGPNAIKRIAKLLTDEPAGTILRVSVIGGGCSGFQYKYDFEAPPPAEDDLLIEKDGARIAVDPTSLEFLKNSMLEYVETLGSAASEMKNPNTTASCGCGNSFSVM